MQRAEDKDIGMTATDMHTKGTTRIAVPTNDGVTVFPKMLGMANGMHIYEYNQRHIKFVKKRNNPYAKTQQHLKTLDVYDLLHDCEIIVSARIGKKGIQRLEDRGMRLIWKKGDIHMVQAAYRLF